MKKPHVVVAAGIIERGGRVLITQRPAGSHLAGFWEFPGGKKEASETIEQCLARELREELGIDAAAERLWRIVKHEYPEKTVEIHFLHCRIVSGEPRALECADCRWVPHAELAQYRFPPADDELIRELANEPCPKKS